MPEEKEFDHTKSRVIRAEIRTSATPRQVWEAWTDPQKLAHWFVDKASGVSTVGGTMTWEFERFGYVLPYEVVASVPERQFALQWNPPPGNPAGILEIQIEREGGETVVRLINSGFREGAEWDDEYEGTVSGWQMALAVLKYYLENYFGQPKSYFFAMQPASFTFDQLRPYFLESSGLAKWLTISGSIGRPGDRCELALRDDGKLTGRVLTVTNREVALSWEEIRGVLELKAFPMGPKRVLSIWGCGWSLDPAKAKEIERQMEAALGRLNAALPASAAHAS